MSDSNSFDSDCVRIAKVVLVVDSRVGKTCFLSRFADDRFEPAAYKYSFQLDFKTRTIRLDWDNVKVHMEFADKHGISLIETSAKTSINVDQAVVQLISAVRKRMSE